MAERTPPHHRQIGIKPTTDSSISRPAMRYSLRSLPILLLLLVAFAACSSGPPLPPLAGDAVILAFGDSLTYGTGATLDRSYPAVLEQLSGRKVVNAGVPGEVTEAGLTRLSVTLEEIRPQLLILCLGGNDMLRHVSPDETVQNLEKMVAISRAQGVPVLLLGVPRPALFGLESAPFYSELAEKFDLPLESEIIPDVLSDTNLKSDQIHPNAEGYRLIAEAIHGKLKQSGAL